MFVIKVAALYINNRNENIVNLLLINCFDESFFGNTLFVCLRVFTPDRICRYDPSFVFPTASNQLLSYFHMVLQKGFLLQQHSCFFFSLYFHLSTFLSYLFCQSLYYSLYNTGRVIVLLVIISIVPLQQSFVLKYSSRLVILPSMFFFCSIKLSVRVEFDKNLLRTRVSQIIKFLWN